MPDQNKRDYYEVLGVSKTATADEIKHAYRTLAKKYHPDVSTEPKDVAEAKFKEISEAYEVLSDPDKRSRYDQYGFAGVDSSFGAGGFNMDDFAQEHGDEFGDIFGDIFGSFFGGSRRNRNPNAPRQGESLRYDLEITLNDVLSGKTATLTVPHTSQCPDCHGTGAKDGKTQVCPECGGRGQMQQVRQTMFGSTVMVSECSRCGGTGRVYVTQCPKCRGSGIVSKNSKIEINVPKGVEDGMQMRVPGAGDAGVNGGPAGDLYVVFHVKDSKGFRRDGPDLWIDAETTYPRLVLGGTVKVKNLEDQEIEATIPSGTQVGGVLKISGQGLPVLNRETRGNLYIRLGITVPKRTSDYEKELLLKLDEEAGNKRTRSKVAKARASLFGKKQRQS